MGGTLMEHGADGQLRYTQRPMPAPKRYRTIHIIRPLSVFYRAEILHGSCEAQYEERLQMQRHCWRLQQQFTQDYRLGMLSLPLSVSGR
jgi:hypothetical protein